MKPLDEEPCVLVCGGVSPPSNLRIIFRLTCSKLMNYAKVSHFDLGQLTKQAGGVF